MSAKVEGVVAPCERAPLPEVEPCVIVIFGASGDLSKRKLIPALYDLFHAGCLKRNFAVVGVGQSTWSDEEFRAQMREGAEKSEDVDEFNNAKWQEFAAHLTYTTGDLTTDAIYNEVAARSEKLHEQIAPNEARNRLFYFSTPPSLAPVMVKHLGAAGLNDESNGWARIIIEKPFGRDLKSAQSLNAEIASVFNEHQVFRIDHYLGKETVQNILVFRFGNSIFEPVWNRNYIDYVEITAAETLGIGGRAGYYEEAGALRDMVANHLLQLLALTAMEPPVAFDADSVREEKVQVFRSIRPMTPEDVARNIVRGQYGAGQVEGQQVPAYRDESGVKKDSNTETFVAVEFCIENWRWAGVPFYVRTGKRLADKVSEIAIHFKRTPQALFARTPEDRIEPNTIVLRIQPDEGMTVTMAAKLPGMEMHAGTVHMVFNYESGFGVRTAAAYETLLLDALQGDATLFTRRDETEAEWRLITPIEEAWAQADAPQFPNYAAGTDGPRAADELLARAGHRWRALQASHLDTQAASDSSSQQTNDGAHVQAQAEEVAKA
ncbi:MAG TPA: glucose-6-phosphate dehydrogenase [Pyrinomonadaceae bacterium]|nr:glucose-6-phosphate dehydrogenase [Pyrinomonadaceae bacterium]